MTLVSAVDRFKYAPVFAYESTFFWQLIDAFKAVAQVVETEPVFAKGLDASMPIGREELEPSPIRPE